MNTRDSILIVDDEKEFRESIKVRKIDFEVTFIFNEVQEMK
ncbi:MAG: hypothetical protein FD151_1878 [bacterium]|nr:MAG: hypothetical protein FD151_1878 [bacterium]